MSNSLANSLCVQDTVDQILLSMNSVKGSDLFYVLVEGPDDCRLYPKFFNEEKTCVEFVGGGKGQVLIALKFLNEKTKRILSICDADFRHLEQDYPAIPNLFFTDCHDIEMTMLNDSQTLTNVLTESRLQSKAADILQNAMNGAVLVGYTRWYNESGVAGLNFKESPIIPYFNIVTSAFDLTLFLNELNRRSPNRKVDIIDIDKFKIKNKTSDFFNLCNGHDVIALIVAIIKIDKHYKNLSTKNFCSVLRASFTLNSFKETKLYANIATWQTSNHYQILS
jgi:hypothetical protein